MGVPSNVLGLLLVVIIFNCTSFFYFLKFQAPRADSSEQDLLKQAKEFMRRSVLTVSDETSTVAGGKKGGEPVGVPKGVRGPWSPAVLPREKWLKELPKVAQTTPRKANAQTPALSKAVEPMPVVDLSAIASKPKRKRPRGIAKLEPGWETRPLATQGASYEWNPLHTIPNTTLYEKYPLLREPVNADLRSYYERKFHKKRKMIHCEHPGEGNVLPGCVYIMGEKRSAVFLQQWEKTADTKIAAFDIMFNSIMKRMGSQLDGKNISFALELRANGTMWITRRRRFEPLLTLAQRDKNVGGLSGLIPNPYFLNPEWWDTYTLKMADAASKKPWDSRKKAVLFRGACGPGGQERIKLMLQRDSEPRLDVGFSRVLGNYKDNLTACIYDVGTKMGVPEDGMAGLAKTGLSSMMSQDDFSDYQYIVHMPGAATGAYSRGLQYLFMHGSIVLLWENDSIEFYYHQLKPRVHYMPVNADNLKSVLDELESDPKLRQTLIDGAIDVLENIVSADNVYKRWEAALSPLLERQTDPMVLPKDACSCNPDAGLPRCKHCEYIEFLHKRVRYDIPGAPGGFFDYSKF